MNQRHQMIVWRGFTRETEHQCQNVRRITPEIIECDCPECIGTGDWARFHPEPHLFPDGLPCVECKGTGRICA